MNKVLMLSLIFYCNLAFARCPYHSQVQHIWDQVSHQRQNYSSTGFLPQNMREFLTSSAAEMQDEERVLLAFYPTGCGFDDFSNESDCFTVMKEFIPFVNELGFKIVFCCPQRHLAHFENHEQMQKFMQNTFRTDLSRKDSPLCFPTKIVLAELEKNSQ